MTVEEYLAAEERAELPSEYHDGEVLQMEGASIWHASISAALTATVFNRLKDKRCMPLITPRLRVTATRYVYPDLALVCGPAEIVDKAGTIDNPKVIVEILSPNTDDYDHGRKYKLYRRISSFDEYVLVSQDEPRVEVFRKQADGTWVFSTHEGLDASFELKSVGLTLPLSEIYANVTFDLDHS